MEVKIGLREIGSVVDLAELLGTSTKRLNFLAYGHHKQARLYFNFEIAKRGGGVRAIASPIPELKAVQKKLAGLLVEHYEPKPCVHGFVRDRSIITNARRHARQRWVGSIDLKDFFPSINFGRVRGALLSTPLSLSPPVANLIAALCVKDNQLPQGAPTSPVLSNLICRRLDREVQALARANRCIYTRYADDLVFSTNRSTFPAQIVRVENCEASSASFVGPQLGELIASNGFVVNETKVWLRSSSARHLVTGCVVNARVNVPREFSRDLRWVLFVWKRFGLQVAVEHANRRGLLSSRRDVSLGATVRGKLSHLRAVRGVEDPLYIRLANEYASIEAVDYEVAQPAAEFVPTKLRLIVEGPSDVLHFGSALSRLHEAGRFTQITFESVTAIGGGPELLKTLKALIKVPPADLTVCIFDSDDKSVLGHVVDPGASFKIFGSTLISVIVVAPPFRPDDEQACTELLYNDRDLLQKDTAGRRLFLSSEFQAPHFGHLTEPVYRQGASGMGLIVDSNVFHKNTNEPVALPKMDFANYVSGGVEPFSHMALDGFEEFFASLLAAVREASEAR